VLSELPSGGCQVTLRKVPWPNFQRRSQGVIPPIEKTKQRQNRDNLQYLVFIEVTSQFGRLGIPNSIWHLAGGLREAQGRAFGLTELWALRELP
jgi:hypothetical protein